MGSRFSFVYLRAIYWTLCAKHGGRCQGFGIAGPLANTLIQNNEDECTIVTVLGTVKAEFVVLQVCVKDYWTQRWEASLVKG